MKPKSQFTPYFRRFCTHPREYVKLKVELGYQTHQVPTNRSAISIVKPLRAQATETNGFLNVALTKTITSLPALNRRATP